MTYGTDVLSFTFPIFPVKHTYHNFQTLNRLNIVDEPYVYFCFQDKPVNAKKKKKKIDFCTLYIHILHSNLKVFTFQKYILIHCLIKKQCFCQALYYIFFQQSRYLNYSPRFANVQRVHCICTSITQSAVNFQY